MPCPTETEEFSPRAPSGRRKPHPPASNWSSPLAGWAERFWGNSSFQVIDKLHSPRHTNSTLGQFKGAGMLRTLATLALILAAHVCMRAQLVTGTLLGTVADPSGAVSAGASVTAVNTLTAEKHSTTTNAQGDYLISSLPVGPYRVEVEAPGFKKYVREGITLDVNQNARVDAKLEIGAVTQEVRV